MTIDPGARQDVAAWTTFTHGAEIPDWVSQAYRDSYRGPRDDGPHHSSESGSVMAASVVDAHCRLAQHRPAAKARSPSIWPTTRRASDPRCRW